MSLDSSAWIDEATKLLVSITLFEMMIATGLSVAGADLLRVARNGRLVALALLANYLLVPAVTVALLRWFDAHPAIASGFLILAVCPGAPYGPPFTAIAKGDTTLSVGLMVLLAGTSALAAPALLACLLPLVPGNEALPVDAHGILVVLLVTQLLPLCIGVTIRQRRPSLAARFLAPALRLSKVLNLAAVALILATKYPVLIEIRLRGLLGMLLLLGASVAIGWWSGGPALETRKSLAVTTALRNVSVGLVIASGDFGPGAVTVVVAYGLVALLGALVLATLAGRAWRIA